MHQFFLKKFIFDFNTSKRYKNKKKINLKLKQIQEFSKLHLDRNAKYQIIV
jgi:hypothetical protein